MRRNGRGVSSDYSARFLGAQQVQNLRNRFSHVLAINCGVRPIYLMFGIRRKLTSDSKNGDSISKYFSNEPKDKKNKIECDL